MRKVQGVILDVDGTLVDSNDAHAHAWMQSLTEHDISVTFPEVRRLIGMGGDNLLPKVAGIRDDTPKGESISKRRGEIFKERYLPTLRPTPGAGELLAHMHREGLRLVVASSAKAEELDPLLEICGANEFIEKITSSDDAERSKPDPDIVRAALEGLGLSPEGVFMLGDTPYDIEAARKTNVSTIALRCGGWKDAELSGAIAIYEHPEDLLKHFDASPLGLSKSSDS